VKIRLEVDVEVASAALTDEQLRAMLPPPELLASNDAVFEAAAREFVRENFGNTDALLFWEAKVRAVVDGVPYATARAVDEHRVDTGAA
jgi:hypothetical protein